MSFGARQYDPQIGRFLSVDPMASDGGQDMLSPYQAMSNNPVSGTDPLGTETGQPGGNLPPPPGGAPPVLTSAFGALVSPVPAGGLWQVSIDGPLMGFSSAVLNDMAGGVNTDPMDLEGQMAGGGDLGAFVTAVLQAGGVLNVITGSQPVSSQIISSLTMAEGNGSGGGASDDAAGDPPSSDGIDASAIAVGGATGSFVSELTTGIEVTVDVTGAAIASGFATVALVFVPIKTAAPSMEMRNVDPYGDPRNWKTEIPDKTNRIRPVNFNNKNYFPGGNGNDFMKWFVRFGAMGAAYKKFWYDPSHPDKH